MIARSLGWRTAGENIDIYRGYESTTTYRGLQNNQLKDLPQDIFSKNTQLGHLDLHNNQLKNLPQDIFSKNTKLEYLDLSYNAIEYLPQSCCNHGNEWKILFLFGNRLKNIPYRAFFNVYTDQEAGEEADKEQIIMLSDNPIETIEPEAFRVGARHLLIYLLRTKLKRLNLNSVIGLGGLDSQL